MTKQCLSADDTIAHLYRITNKKTGEYYIGKHNGWSQKQKGGSYYWGSGTRIINAVKKHGKENFTYDILVYGNVDYIIDLEAKYVTKELIENDTLCLNLVTGGVARREYLKESREKISLAQKGKKRNLTDEQRRKLSEKQKGKKYFLGKNHTEETKQKIRETRAKQVFSEEAMEKKKKTISSLLWMNDGIRSYRVKPENIESKKEKGLVEGRIHNFVTDEYREKIRMNTKEQWKKHKEVSSGPLTTGEKS